MRQPDVLTTIHDRFSVGQVIDIGGIGIFYRVLDVQPYLGGFGVWLEELEEGKA